MPLAEQLADPSTAAAGMSNKKITFVLPIATKGTGRDEEDLERVGILLKSLYWAADADDIQKLYIVTTEHDYPAVTQRVNEFVTSLRIEVVREADICPEFLSQPDTTNAWPRPNQGWFRQQLIKLAMYEHVDTDCYMTLDSDVIFVKQFSHHDILADGRALTATFGPNELFHLFKAAVASHEVSVRLTRMRQAETVLRFKLSPEFCNRYYGETPVVLCRPVVEQLARRLEEVHASPWRTALLKLLPWTEYSLYYLCAEHYGLFDTYHRIGGMDAVLRLQSSLWRSPDSYNECRALSNWDFRSIMRAQADGIAVVVQSYLGYRTRDVEALVNDALRPADSAERGSRR